MTYNPLKRKAGIDVEDMDISNLRDCKLARIHGIVTQLSPVKTSQKNPSCRYFDMKLQDNSKTVRAVSFEPRHRSLLEKYQNSGAAVCLSGEVKSNGREVVLNSTTPVDSERNFTVSSQAPPSGEETSTMNVEELADMSSGQEVAVNIKVVKLGKIENVTSKRRGSELRKMECMVADSTGSCRLVLWEDDVSKLKQNMSYCLRCVTVSSFHGVKYLSFGVNAAFAEIDDIGQTSNIECGGGESGMFVPCKTIIGEIEAIAFYEEYLGCFRCKGKAKQSDDANGIIECSRCGMIMKEKRAQKKRVAKVVVTCGDDEHTVTIFEDQIEQIIDGLHEDTDVKTKLLSIDGPVSLNIDCRNVVVGTGVVKQSAV